MKVSKISLSTLQEKLSKYQMKQIMAGSGPGPCQGEAESCGFLQNCCDGLVCKDWEGGGASQSGSCFKTGS